jgi:hypothetical protein
LLWAVYKARFPEFKDISDAIRQKYSKLVCKLVDSLNEQAGGIMPVAETTYTEIGAFDAKTKLSEILRKVEQGERFTITQAGPRGGGCCAQPAQGSRQRVA